MPEYLSPGVYVEEIDAGPKPIEGVSTSTAGAVGVTAFGPTRGKPELITSFAEFLRRFGGFLPEPDPATVNNWALNPTEGGRWWHFPLAVKGFFDNGGQRLYVKRVISSTATKAELIMGQGVISEITQDAPATATELRLRHLISIRVGSNIDLFVNGFFTATFQVTAYTGTSTVVLNNPIGQEVKGGRDFVQVVQRQAVVAPQPGQDDARLTVRAKSEGDWGGSGTSGNGISVRMRPMIGATLKLMADPVLGGTPFSTTVAAQANAGDTNITVASATGLANGNRVRIGETEHVISNLRSEFQATVAVVANAGDTDITVNDVSGLAVNDTVTIQNQRYVISAIDPGPPRIITISPAVPAGQTWAIGDTVTRETVFTIAPAVPASPTWTVGTPVRRMRPAYAPATPGTTVSVRNASQLYEGALVELDNGTLKEIRSVDSIAGDTVTLSTPDLANAYFEDNRLRVIEAEVHARYQRNFVTQAEERFSNLRLVNDGSLSYFVTHVNTLSSLIDLEAGLGFAADTILEFPSVAPANNPPVPPLPQANPELQWADLANGADNIPGLTVDDFVGVDLGSERRTGIQALEDIDEISICLAPGMWSSTIHSALIQHCEILKDRFAILDSKDGLSIEGIREAREVLDSKYAAIYYPWVEVRDPSVRRNVHIAPSGHMAGIYARVDIERGVHKAPANEGIRGITKIAQDVTKRQQDLLNPKGINALRFFPGRGNRVWGARTVSSDPSWKYINVRRLFIYVEESIDEATQWVVFEPNDEPLWARVRQTITNFLTSTWRSGALQGSKPDEAFFVKCDRTTMTQDDIDNGRLIVLIGIAPVKPAEFVIFRIQQKTLDQKAS
ncbi:MAG TPA: phage tail sheath subtilisin-like domain-containing protein [Blastocatellia bacterium]|nr:phage tail sheath subtilisin-like domain-containing protein [Blastocatellia bacterium]